MNGERVEKQCNLLHIHTLYAALLILINPRNVHTTVVDVYWSDLSCPRPLGLPRFFIRITYWAVWALRPIIASWMFFLLFQKRSVRRYAFWRCCELAPLASPLYPLEMSTLNQFIPGLLEIQIKLRKNVGVQFLKDNHGDGGDGIKVARNCRAFEDWLALSNKDGIRVSGKLKASLKVLCRGDLKWRVLKRRRRNSRFKMSSWWQLVDAFWAFDNTVKGFVWL